MNYYIAVGSEHRGPFPPDQLLAQGLRPETMVWTDGMPQWARADSVGELAGLFTAPAAGVAPGYATPSGYAAPSAYAGPTGAMQSPEIRAAANNKMAAGLCGILIGGLGIHKFILGMTNAGLIMLLVTILTCGFGGIIMHIIGIIEGITYLTKSDEEFYQTYVVQKKAWF